jgi:heterotetrameric sarcosine oxidase delta subunit
MLIITCPYCGPRNDEEFTYQSEVIARPDVSVDPVTWRRYLYTKRNVSGWEEERWFHVSGCRRFLRVERHTLTNEIRRVSAIGPDRA